MTKRKSASEWREEANGLRAELQALYELSEKDGLSDDEQARFDTLLAEDGPIKDCEAGEARAAEVDRLMLAHAEKARNSESLTAPCVGPSKAAESQPKAQDDGRILLRGQRSRHFEDPRHAKAAAEWFAWTTSPSEADRQQHAAAMQRFGGEEYAAQSIGTDGKGGYLVPTPIATEIIKHRDAVAVAPQLVNTITMGQETLGINEETGDVTVTYPGESSAITPSDVDYTRHTLTVVKRAAMVKMSREFIADANVSAADQVIDNLSYRFAHALDNEFINGDGTGTYGGETGLTGAVTQTAQADSGEVTVDLLDLPDYKACKDALPHRYQEGAAWLMKPAAWYQLELLLMQAGGAATAEFAAGLTNTRTFMGKPVFLSDLFPAEGADEYVAFYGNFRRGVTVGDRADMAIATSVDRYFEADDVAIRATHRYDILVHKPAAYVGLQLASS